MPLQTTYLSKWFRHPFLDESSVVRSFSAALPEGGVAFVAQNNRMLRVETGAKPSLKMILQKKKSG